MLAPYGGRVTLVHARYDEIGEILAALGQPSVQGVLFDLGVSSPQLDDPGRGFAYSYDAPLDMRMDQTGPLTAADVVNTYPAARLAQVLREYGEERFARRIADAVVRERSRAPLTSTMRLTEIVRDSIPAPARRSGGNPAKRTFQALRIEVNGELEALRRALPAALDAVAVGRPDRRARLPLARGPHGQAGARGQRGGHAPRRDCRSRSRPPSRGSGSSPGAASGPRRRKWRPTRARRRPGCGPPSESGRRHDRAKGARCRLD